MSPILHELSPIQSQSSPLAIPPLDARSFVMSDTRPKKVWVAVLLAIALGPVGLLYCTMTGTIVMTIATIPIWLVFGNLAYLILSLVCGFWAWRSARESASILD